jgi:hypothetical protein
MSFKFNKSSLAKECKHAFITPSEWTRERWPERHIEQEQLDEMLSTLTIQYTLRSNPHA